MDPLGTATELAARIKARPKVQLHVRPDAVIWMAITLGHHGIAHAVDLVADDKLPTGRVFVEGGIESVV